MERVYRILAFLSFAFAFFLLDKGGKILGYPCTKNNSLRLLMKSFIVRQSSVIFRRLTKIIS